MQKVNAKKDWKLKTTSRLLSRLKRLQLISKLRWFIKDVIKACQWFVFGFKDQDWDWAYGFNVIEYKARRMAKSFTACEFHDHKTDIKELTEVSQLCKILAVDYEFDYAFEKINKKWGDHEKKTGKLAEELGGWSYAPKMVKTKKEYKKYHAEFKKAMREGQKLRRKAFQRFMELLKTRSDCWSC